MNGGYRHHHAHAGAARRWARSRRRTPSGPGSAEAVRRLHEPGIEVVMLTGDSRAVADVAVEAGDVVLGAQRPARRAPDRGAVEGDYRKMIQKLWWAAGYDIVAIPLAAGVAHGRGIVLSPALGAVLMPLSTGAVAVNAQLLGRAGL